MSARWLIPFATLAAPCWAQSLPLDEVMAHLAQAPQRRASFVEEKSFAALTTPLRSEGHLLFRRPDHLEMTTTAPRPERFVVDGNRIVVDASNDPPRVLDIGGQPGLAALVDTVRGTLSGDLARLRQGFTVSGAGTPADWQIVLQPRDPALAGLLQEVRLAGGADLRVIQTVAPNGDTDTLTVTPLP